MTIIYKKNENWKKSILDSSVTIRGAFSNLEKTGLQIIFVCSKNKKLVGTVTDGDIRRGLMSGMSLNDKIIKIVNKEPVLISQDIDLNTATKIMQINKIKSLPVINKFRKLMNVYFLNSLQDTNNNYDIVIMAGGKGTRLHPITKSIPKAMVKVCGEPIVEIIIKKFIKFGFSNFYLSVNHLKNKIINYLQSGERLGVTIKYIKEKKPLGTIGSLGLLNNVSKNFLIINCDVLTNLNFLEFIKFHEDSKSSVTIAANVIQQYSNFGEIKTDGNKVVSFAEKPIEKKYNNSGIYIFNRSTLKYIKKNQKLDINNFVNFLLKKNIKVNIFPIYENWTDIGIKSELNKVNKTTIK